MAGSIRACAGEAVRVRRFFEAWPPLTLLALGWIALMVIVALGADFFAPYSFTALDLRARLHAPVFMGGTWAHPLGSDELGRDVLSRLIMSIQLSLLIAFFGTMIAAAFGTAMGFVAAHFRGKVEAMILMLIDFQASMPFLIIALAVLAFFGNNLPLFVMLMGLNSWERYARIARGLTLSANEQGYAAAVRQLGASNVRVYGLHVLPNIASTLIVSMTITFPETILLESGLSFLGLGVQPPTAECGSMLAAERNNVFTSFFLVLFPGIMIMINVLAFNLLGDGLRDALDPRLNK